MSAISPSQLPNHNFQEEHKRFYLFLPTFFTDSCRRSCRSPVGGQLISQRAALQTHPEAIGGHRRRARGPRPWSLSFAESGLHPAGVPVEAVEAAVPVKDGWKILLIYCL